MRKEQNDQVTDKLPMEVDEPSFGEKRCKVEKAQNNDSLMIRIQHAQILDFLEGKRVALLVSGPLHETPTSLKLRTAEPIRLIKMAMEDVERSLLMCEQALNELQS